MAQCPLIHMYMCVHIHIHGVCVRQSQLASSGGVGFGVGFSGRWVCLISSRACEQRRKGTSRMKIENRYLCKASSNSQKQLQLRKQAQNAVTTRQLGLWGGGEVMRQDGKENVQENCKWQTPNCFIIYAKCHCVARRLYQSLYRDMNVRNTS